MISHDLNSSSMTCSANSVCDLCRSNTTWDPRSCKACGVANGASAFPYVQTKTIPNTSFPLSANQAVPTYLEFRNIDLFPGEEPGID